jgi:hypothetical protein
MIWLPRIAWAAVSIIACCGRLTPAWGDGGRIVHVERAAGIVVTAFAAPDPTVSAPVDLSFLVQPEQTHTDVAADLQIAVFCELSDRPEISVSAPATRELATNKLLHAAQLELAAPGEWIVHVSIQADQRTLRIQFPVVVGDGAPVSPWRSAVGFPLGAIILFGIHRLLSSRPPRAASAVARSTRRLM